MHKTIRYDKRVSVENWHASCQFNLGHRLKKLKMF